MYHVKKRGGSPSFGGLPCELSMQIGEFAMDLFTGKPQRGASCRGVLPKVEVSLSRIEWRRQSAQLPAFAWQESDPELSFDD